VCSLHRVTLTICESLPILKAQTRISMPENPIIIATRGSALALAQSTMILNLCRNNFPDVDFELQIIKTTGDKLQTVANAAINSNLPRGLFTKELEVALLERSADLAVHSLKDLPTDLPAGLTLGAVTQRADVRDVLIYRDASAHRGFVPGTRLAQFPANAVVATSSTRRKAQMLEINPRLKVVEIRGNVHTRLQKVAENPELDATVLAAAGLSRLNITITSGGELKGGGVPDGLCAVPFEHGEMLPCVGQGAIGIEIRERDDRLNSMCQRLNHDETFRCVTAERALLRAMGGGCQTPIGAYAELSGDDIRLRAISFLQAEVRRAEGTRGLNDAAALGEEVAVQLKKPS
jgi:hydroxymethylbilane synthase